MDFRFRPGLESLDGRIVPDAGPGDPPPTQPDQPADPVTDETITVGDLVLTIQDGALYLDGEQIGTYGEAGNLTLTDGTVYTTDENGTVLVNGETPPPVTLGNVETVDAIYTDQQVTNLRADASQVNADQPSHPQRGRLDDLDRRLGELNGLARDLEGRLDGLRQRHGGLTDALTDVQGELDRLRRGLQNNTDQAARDRLRAAILALESVRDSIKARADEVKKQMDDLNRQLDDVNRQLGQVFGEMLDIIMPIRGGIEPNM